MKTLLLILVLIGCNGIEDGETGPSSPICDEIESPEKGESDDGEECDED